MNKAQYEIKKKYLAAKIKAYYAKLDRKKEAADGIFKAKEKAKISGEQGKWDNKAVKFEARMAKFPARAAKWNKEWRRRKVEGGHRKDPQEEQQMVKLRPGYAESLPETIDRILDKGVVIDLKLRLAILEAHLIKIRATIIFSSFETTAKYGLPFPAGINRETAAWKNLLAKERCPQCMKLVEEEELREGCPWCNFTLSS